jgi:NADH dehydrogenase
MITGAFGLTGRHIAARLLAMGMPVRTLTNTRATEDPFGGRVAAYPLCFDRPDTLARHLEGVEVLYNTYWVRFDHARFTHEEAVKNTRILFEAARRAGVKRIVHVSITHPDIASPLPYFRGKAQLEEALAGSGIPHAILRPTVLFGGTAILLNNIAWMLRRFPVFGVFGDGNYKLQPIHVDDLAALAVGQATGREAGGNTCINATGPETFTFRELVRAIGTATGRDRPLISIHPEIGLAVGRLCSLFLNDVLITREEIRGLMAGLLATETPATGTTRLTDWLATHGATLGQKYASELARRRQRR